MKHYPKNWIPGKWKDLTRRDQVFLIWAALSVIWGCVMSVAPDAPAWLSYSSVINLFGCFFYMIKLAYGKDNEGSCEDEAENEEDCDDDTDPDIDDEGSDEDKNGL